MSEEKLRQRIAELEQKLSQTREREKSVSDLLEKKLNEIYTHYQISRTIGSLLDLQEMLRQVMGTVRKALPFDRVSVYLFDETTAQLELIFFSGLEVTRKIMISGGEGVPGRIAASGEHLHLHDLSLFYDTFNDFIHFTEEKKRSGSYIGIALKVHNSTIGVLGIDCPDKNGLTMDDLDFLAILSHQIAGGIERLRLFERNQQLSRLDSLTGLYNRRVFQERLAREISRRERTGKPLSLIMLDVDDFKKFNDDFGDDAGDNVLRNLARIVSRQCRCGSIDICCRYGGGQFAIILPELELHNAVKAAERIRKAVESHSFGINETGMTEKIAVSVGVAGIAEGRDLSAEHLVRKADEALALSKKNGRNQVSYSPFDEPEQ